MDVPYKPHRIETPDGLMVAAQEWGNRDGPAILFIHGFAQSHLAWRRQVESALADEFRLVTYDLRGHGDSDKPLERARYRDSQAWGDELDAVIRTTGLVRPVLVGWSYAGRVIADYLTSHGTLALAGINYVAALTASGPGFVSEAPRLMPPMASDDLAGAIQATRTFLRACFATPPSPDEFEIMLAFNMLVPRAVRAAMRDRPMAADGLLAALDLPVLVSHGTEDRLVSVAVGRHTAATVPGAALAIYDGIGHAPFWEDAPRFNRELAAFVRAVQTGT